MVDGIHGDAGTALRQLISQPSSDGGTAFENKSDDDCFMGSEQDVCHIPSDQISNTLERLINNTSL